MCTHTVLAVDRLQSGVRGALDRIVGEGLHPSGGLGGGNIVESKWQGRASFLDNGTSMIQERKELVIDLLLSRFSVKGLWPTPKLKCLPSECQC